MPRTNLTAVLSLASAIACAVACSSKGDPASPSAPPPSPLDGTTTPIASETVAPSMYVAKVKNVLVGLPPTDAEVKAVEADPTQLKALIDDVDGSCRSTRRRCCASSSSRSSRRRSRSSISPTRRYPRPARHQRLDHAAPRAERRGELRAHGARARRRGAAAHRGDDDAALHDDARAHGALRVPRRVAGRRRRQGHRPLQAGATRSFRSPSSAAPGRSRSPRRSTRRARTTCTGTTPTSRPPGDARAGCARIPSSTRPQRRSTLHYLLYGSLDGRKNPTTGGTQLPTSRRHARRRRSSPATDFTDWKMVTMRPPEGRRERRRTFYDLATLRTATELVLERPARRASSRTPAFFANWQTNTSNQMRVTMNQTLIVATGAPVDGTDTDDADSTPRARRGARDAPACFACHQTLDPTRSILAATLLVELPQPDRDARSRPAGAVRVPGRHAAGGTIDDLGATLAQPPALRAGLGAEALLLRELAACDADDPEFQRIVGVFQSSGYSWNALVSELLSSPITTNAARRRRHRRQRRGRRGLAARSPLRGAERAPRLQRRLRARRADREAATRRPSREIVSGLPSDGYGRGVDRAGSAQRADALLPRRHREHLRGGRRRSSSTCNCDAAPGVKQWSSAAARRGDRRLRAAS